jgi:hypothetical protein
VRTTSQVVRLDWEKLMASPEFGAGIWLFGQFVDRYASDAYGPPVSTLEAIDRAGQVGSLVALDINSERRSGGGIG